MDTKLLIIYSTTYNVPIFLGFAVFREIWLFLVAINCRCPDLRLQISLFNEHLFIWSYSFILRYLWILSFCCLIFRFDPMMVAKLRPETDIPGLYMTGQVCNHENLPFGYTTFIVVFHSKIAIICIIYCLYMGEIIKNLSNCTY